MKVIFLRPVSAAPFIGSGFFSPLTAGYGRRYCPRKNKRRGSHWGEVRRLCTPDLGDGVFERIWRQVVRKDQRPLLFLWKPVAHRDTHLGLVVPLKTSRTSCPVLPALVYFRENPRLIMYYGELKMIMFDKNGLSPRLFLLCSLSWCLFFLDFRRSLILGLLPLLEDSCWEGTLRAF